MKKHDKHPKLIRPAGDQYARTDVALLGSTCAVMDPLIEEWAQALSKSYRTLSVIGVHGETAEAKSLQVGEKRFSTSFSAWSEYDERIQRSEFDVALVNGNHYPAARQIVFVDPKKSGTLERRREQLTDILAVVVCPGADGMPDWLSETVKAQDGEVILCRLEKASTAVLPLLNHVLSTRVPALNALILTGGKSIRMGTRKADLVYRTNGETEGARMARLCNDLLPGRVHISVADADQPTIAGFPNLADRFLGLGPAGAISSAFLSDPNAAWLVLACDLPLLEKSHLEQLIEGRDARKFATAYQLASQPFPEPLVAIYEPRAYARLLQFLGMGYSCPRKVLINSEVKILETADEAAFRNANTPEDRAGILKMLV
ncbi:NTP transferase domain-containing protein [Neolewinella persica]|uniref:NTP transferase domain-containing protein n=1 Tax=Neolewinella persica TaxID=70998 RepID=UPI00036FF94B|nr:NTP transferase domain-containing protein [Neolewinella persica]